MRLGVARFATARVRCEPNRRLRLRTQPKKFLAFMSWRKVMGFSTDAIHVGQEPDALTGSIVAPIYPTSTYVIEEMGKSKGYDYARTNHPNRKALERTIAKLENGHAAYVFTSGMAAIDAVFCLLRPGDHTILSQSVYGGVFRITTQLLVQFGLEFSYVDTSNLEKVKQAIKPNTKMIYVETPTNPTMIVTDLAAIAKLGHERNLTVVVDNTFLSPYLQQPLALGADIVVHSMTKFLNGHSDCTGGAVIVSTPEQAQKIYFVQRSAGAGLAPMDCFLVSRGVKTLAVRMDRHNSNGMTVAKYLAAHAQVKHVRYDRRCPGAHGLLFGFARRQDASGAHGPPQFQRHDGGKVPRGSCQGKTRHLPRTGFPSTARNRQEAAARLRRDDFV